jgi:hypothetical protein
MQKGQNSLLFYWRNLDWPAPGLVLARLNGPGRAVLANGTMQFCSTSNGAASPTAAADLACKKVAAALAHGHGHGALRHGVVQCAREEAAMESCLTTTRYTITRTLSSHFHLTLGFFSVLVRLIFSCMYSGLILVWTKIGL